MRLWPYMYSSIMKRKRRLSATAEWLKENRRQAKLELEGILAEDAEPLPLPLPLLPRKKKTLKEAYQDAASALTLLTPEELAEEFTPKPPKSHWATAMALIDRTYVCPKCDARKRYRRNPRNKVPICDGDSQFLCPFKILKSGVRMINTTRPGHAYTIVGGVPPPDKR